MELIIYVLQIPFVVLWGLLAGYLLLLTVVAAVPRHNNLGRSKHTKERRFIFVVPAHNEEKLISRTLESIYNVDYSKNLFRVVVVADNCTDSTADLARSSGAIVHERFDTRKQGKGAALNWITARLSETNDFSDAYIFIDADSTISPNFVNEMNQYLDLGHLAIQSSSLVHDISDSARGKLIAIAYFLFNHIRPLGRSKLGFSVGLRGNGMCFDRSLISRISWNEESLVEDLDLGNQLLSEGVKVAFSPNALVSSDLPTMQAGVDSQRMRWERGRLLSNLNELPKLLKKALVCGHVSLFETTFDLMLPPLALFGMVVLMFFLLNSVLAFLGYEKEMVLTVLWGLILAALILHVTLGVLIGRTHGKDFVGDLLAFSSVPRYLLLESRLVQNYAVEKDTVAVDPHSQINQKGTSKNVRRN